MRGGISRAGGLAGLVALALVLALGGGSAAAATPAPLGLPCQAQNGVRFCQGGFQAPGFAPFGFDSRVPSFDGAPLDTDVTLPPTGNGPWPTIVMIHGWGNDKTSFESTSPNGDGNETFHWNNVYYAQRGYAVVNYTARGWGNSCGSPSSRTPACTSDHGWIHLDDRAFEARDAQWLLGTLVDEGIAKANGLGATGISYGGGLSLELAYLNNRMAVRDTLGGPETLEQWKSPHGVPLHLAGAYPRWLWSDLVSSLLPNGHFLDFDPSTAGLSRTPVGIPIQSYIEGLYALGVKGGYYAPPGVDPGSDLATWHARVGSGDPYTDPETATILNEIYGHHQAYGLGGTPSSLLLQDGFTDDLFPVAESLRVYESLLQANPNADVALQVGDLGHSRGSNKVNTDHYFQDQGSNFFDLHLKGSAPSPPPDPGSVTAFTQTCPASSPGGGPYTAPSWQQLHPGAFRFGSAAAQTITSGGGNPSTGASFDPIANSDACKSVATETASDTAVYQGPTVTGGFTMMGLPTVSANVSVTGNEAQLDSRLWDVAPNGQQTLISRGAYRLSPGQTSVLFQLRGNGWHFAPGHVPKLELLGADAPYLQPNKEAFSISISNAVVELPTLEGPSATPQIGAPQLAQQLGVTRRFRLIVRPRHAKKGQQVRFWFTAEYFANHHWHRLRGVVVSFDGDQMRTGHRGRATAVVDLGRRGRLRVVASHVGYLTDVRFVRVTR